MTFSELRTSRAAHCQLDWRKPQVERARPDRAIQAQTAVFLSPSHPDSQIVRVVDICEPERLGCILLLPWCLQLHMARDLRLWSLTPAGPGATENPRRVFRLHESRQRGRFSLTGREQQHWAGTTGD